jgi:hypothetical protein
MQMPGRLPLIVVLFVLFGSGFAHGQDAAGKQTSRDRELMRRAVAAQKEAESALAIVQGEKATLEAKLNEALAKAEAAGASVGRQARRAAEAAKEADLLRTGQSKLSEEKAALEIRAAALAADLKKSSDALEAARSQLAARNGEIESERRKVSELGQARTRCVEDNRALSDVLTDLMDRYRKVGVMEALRRAEPFTGIERVRVESLLEEYRTRVDAASPPR